MARVILGISNSIIGVEIFWVDIAYHAGRKSTIEVDVKRNMSVIKGTLSWLDCLV